MDYSGLIKNTRELLLKHKADWEALWAGYADEISRNLPFIQVMHRRFNQWKPLYLYLTKTEAGKASNKVTFQLRYLGTRVAELIASRSQITLSTKGYEKTNKDLFGCQISLNDSDWNGLEAKEFRRHFRDKPRDDKNETQPEHRIESLLLTEFSKRQTSKKALRGIQPVKIAGVRFPMPTPLAASEHGEIKYKGFRGGGIDILARVRTGRRTNLCIIELKDENKDGEPASDALEQAIIYTVFIRELLRSKSGATWWKLFGFRDPCVPEPLVLYAACAMPNKRGADTSFADNEYGIYYNDEDDKIRLHYIYFKDCGDRIGIPRTSLGTHEEIFVSRHPSEEFIQRVREIKASDPEPFRILYSPPEDSLGSNT
ncbi:MAG: hypothetical protein LBC63_07020 [Holophagales bacterium]|jgi:hypothetical protein|nr:hypothetical protein [Holophagales bacterium]